MTAGSVETSRVRVVLGIVAVGCVALAPGTSLGVAGVVPLTSNCWCVATADYTTRSGWNFAEAWGETSHTRSHVRLQCSDLSGPDGPYARWELFAEVSDFQYRNYATAEIVRSQSSITIGTAEGIPAGTPLTLSVYGELLSYFFGAQLILYRGEQQILVMETDNQTHTVDVFAGETLTPSALAGSFAMVGTDWGRFTLSVTPEPATLAGLLVLSILIRRR